MNDHGVEARDPVEGEAEPMSTPSLTHPADAGLPPLPAERGPAPGVEAPVVLRGVRGWLQRRVLITAGMLFVGAFIVYGLFSWNRFVKPSNDTHFAYMAHSLLKGQLEMPVYPPPHGNDWASYVEVNLKEDQTLRGVFLDDPFNHQIKERRFLALDGQMYLIERRDEDRAASREDQRAHPERYWRGYRVYYYVSFPPMPAILMMPAVAMTSESKLDLKDPTKLGINDVQFTVFFAALNVALCFLFLQLLTHLGVSARSLRANVVLTVLYGFSTNVLWCSILGQVWFTALVVGMAFTWLYMMAAINARHPLLAGMALACAFATRTPLAFSVVFFAYFLFFPDGRWRRTDWLPTFRKAALFALPILIVGGLVMWMNHARFGNVFEFGHRYLGGHIAWMHPIHRRIATYGLFNVHFLSKNLMAAFTLLPRLQDSAPYVIVSKHGMSLFLTTPALLYLVAYRSGARRLDRKWLWALALTVVAVAVPGLFYQNTGWSQFGFRFSLDYTPYLVVLLALNRRRIGAFFIALVIAGFLVNSFGAITFGRSAKNYADWIIDPDR